MKVFKDISYEQDGYGIIGLINSNSDLEHSIYKQVDGGVIDLKDRVYDKCELSKFLEIELKDFLNRNIPTLFILGHDISLELANGKDIFRDELDEEVYEVSHSIMQGCEYGEVFIESKNIMCSWKIL